MNSARMALVDDDVGDVDAVDADAVDADAVDADAVDADAVDADAVDAGAVDATLDEGAECEWIQAHRALSRLARQRARADAEEGRWLLKARRSAAHLHMGFGGFAEYVERCFGYGPRSTHEKLRVAEALEHLPVLTQALESGTLCWSALRELTRVATPETESAWLDIARGKLSRELEPLVAGARPGDLPNAARSPEARRHVLRFEVTAETYATFRESTVQLRRESDASLDDDAVLLAMARAVLGGPRDDGRASYQVSLCVCPECGRGTQAAGGAIVPVGPAIVAMAACDAQQIGYVSESAHVGATAGARNVTPDDGVPFDDGNPAAAEADVPAAVVPPLTGAAHESAADAANDRSRSTDVALDEDAAAPTHADLPASSAPRRAHTGTRAMEAIPERDATVAFDEAAAREREAPTHAAQPASSAPRHAHTGTRATRAIAALDAAVASDEAVALNRDAPAHADRLAWSAPRHAHTGTRATQTIPPALRRRVLARDHHRCRVPGCQSSAYLDLHHLRPRAEGGPNTAANLIPLCGAHHRGVHTGALVIEGQSAENLRFYHADGTPYGQPADPQVVDVQAKVFSGLRNIGFRERDARSVLDQLRRDPALASLGVKELMRAALERIALPRRGHRSGFQ